MKDNEAMISDVIRKLSTNNSIPYHCVNNKITKGIAQSILISVI